MPRQDDEKFSNRLDTAAKARAEMLAKAKARAAERFKERRRGRPASRFAARHYHPRRRTGRGASAPAWIVRNQPKQEMISPFPINFQITAGQSFLLEADFQQQQARGVVVGAAGGLDPVQAERAEGEAGDGVDGGGGVGGGTWSKIPPFSSVVMIRTMPLADVQSFPVITALTILER